MKKILSIFVVLVLSVGILFSATAHARNENALDDGYGNPSLIGVFNGETKRLQVDANGYVKAVLTDISSLTITGSSTTQHVLLIDANATTGTTGISTVRIDSENTDVAGLYITSPVDATGTSDILDRHALVAVSEGIGGAANFYRNVSGSTNPVVNIRNDHVDDQGTTLLVQTDSDASANSPMAIFQSISSAHDQPTVSIVQSGSGEGLVITRAGSNSTGAVIDSIGANAQAMSLKMISEEVTISIAEGNTPVVLTSGNLAPAGSIIVGCTMRVTDAPGGGATTIEIGITGGDLDQLIDGVSCDGLGETADSHTDGATEWIGMLRNVSATTLTLTTDADVTGDEMKIRVTVWYYDLTASTS